MATRWSKAAMTACLMLAACSARTEQARVADAGAQPAAYAALEASTDEAAAFVWVSLDPDATADEMCPTGPRAEACLGLRPASARAGRAVFRSEKPVTLASGRWAVRDQGRDLGLMVAIRRAGESGGSDDGKAQDLPTPKFTSFAAQRSERRATAVSALKDIADHVPSSFGDTYYDADLITWGHEASHGIHSAIRNTLNKTGGAANGFYVLGDKAVLVPEPGFRKSQVAAHVPQALRNLDITKRFDTYVSGQSAWDDRPLYLWDEWNAYVNGSTVALGMLEEGQGRPRADALMGTAEFTVYAWAVAMAAEKLDPKAAEGEQFKGFLAYNTQRAFSVMAKAMAKGDMNAGDVRAYFSRLASDPQAAGMRAFAQRYFGEARFEAWLSSLRP